MRRLLAVALLAAMASLAACGSDDGARVRYIDGRKCIETDTGISCDWTQK